jgi:hypothetical protein
MDDQMKLVARFSRKLSDQFVFDEEFRQILDLFPRRKIPFCWHCRQRLNRHRPRHFIPDFGSNPGENNRDGGSRNVKPFTATRRRIEIGHDALGNERRGRGQYCGRSFKVSQPCDGDGSIRRVARATSSRRPKCATGVLASGRARDAWKRDHCRKTSFWQGVAARFAVELCLAESAVNQGPASCQQTRQHRPQISESKPLPTGRKSRLTSRDDPPH